MLDTNQAAEVVRPMDAAQRMVIELPTGEEIQVMVAEVGQDLEGQHQLRLDGPLEVGGWTSLGYGPVAITVEVPGERVEVAVVAPTKRLRLQIGEFWSLASRGRFAYEDRRRFKRIRSLVELPEASAVLAGLIDDPSWFEKLVATWLIAGELVDEDLAVGEVV